MKKLFTLTISCVAIILLTFTAISADTVSTVTPTPPAGIITQVQSPVKPFVLPIIKNTGFYRAKVRIPIKTVVEWPAYITFLRPNNKGPYAMDLKYDTAGDFYYVDLPFSRDSTIGFDMYYDYGTWEILTVGAYSSDDNQLHRYVNQKYYAADLKGSIPIDFDLYKFNVQNLNGKVVDASNLTSNKILRKTVGDKTELKKAWASSKYLYYGGTTLYFDIKDTNGIVSGLLKMREPGYNYHEFFLEINPRTGYASLDFTSYQDIEYSRLFRSLYVFSVSFTDTLGNITTFYAKSNYSPPLMENEFDFTKCNIKTRSGATSTVSDVKLSKTSIKLKVKKDLRLIATSIPAHVYNVDIVWRSSNPKVAKVSRAGHVTAIKPGTAYITAYPYIGYGYDRCKVVVTK